MTKPDSNEPMKGSPPRGLWHKLLKGSTDNRPTRFHTQDGGLAPFGAYFRLPVALGQWLQLRFFGRRVECPWIPSSATRLIERHLSPGARVLEIGAGMSTLWLAQRCKSLLSIEADQEWFDRLGAILAERGLKHVDLQFRWRADDMCDFSTIPDASLDLCFIDGGPRLECLRAALPKLKPDGWLYVDNTDLYPDTKEYLATLPPAQSCLTFHRGFAPACLFVNEGAILQMVPAR